ncbi:MAG: Rne/Rng family ribonuclease [Candidatus Auribacterota bacterium]|nr:Rne/Rng family ribonuclease [Candidatus Auribacterota bacterium]
MNRIFINVEQQEQRIAFMVGDRLEHFYIERSSDEPIAGDIYKGVVKNIVPSIQAAFIDIGTGKNGFIHVSDLKENIEFDTFAPRKDTNVKKRSGQNASISDILVDGQEIIVQVTKEAIKSKGVRLTNDISIPGRNLVLIPAPDKNNQRGISRKITDRNERKRLKELLEKLKIPKHYGVILRTAGELATQKNFERDMAYLIKSWEEIAKEAKKKQGPCLLHSEFDISIKIIRDLFTPEIDEVIIDSKEEYYKIKKYFRHFFPEIKAKIIYYRRKTPLFDAYAIEDELEKMFQRKFWLKCGGYIVIDETEALVAIDVNTGRNVAHKNLEDTIRATNIEAAEEIARQLRLRNIGGIIVIDFIDMAKRENRKAVLQQLEESLKKDKAKTNILPLSQIGLVEMTRQRIKESINQELYEKCEHCGGRGLRKSLMSLSIEAHRKIKRVLLKTREKQVKISINPVVMDAMLADNPQLKRRLERSFRKKIFIEPDETVPRESLKVEFPPSDKVQFI